MTPHYFAANKVNAKKKIAWIHTDYSYVELDQKSELRMWEVYDYIASISDACTKGFCKKFPTLKNKIIRVIILFQRILLKVKQWHLMYQKK